MIHPDNAQRIVDTVVSVAVLFFLAYCLWAVVS